MRVLCLLSLLFLFGCGNQEKNGECSKVKTSNRCHFKVKSLEFPEYAWFDGWWGNKVEVEPVYKKSDESLFSVQLYYEDWKVGADAPFSRQSLGYSSGSPGEHNPELMLCVDDVEENGTLGLKVRFSEVPNTLWGDRFIPYPKGTALKGGGSGPSSKFGKEINFGDSFLIYQISLREPESVDAKPYDTWGYRKFFVKIDVTSDNFKLETF